MKTDSALRIEVALRGARVAKLALELISLDPSLVHLQLVEVVKEVQQIDRMLAAAEREAQTAQVTL